jgi:hypothetical protein
MKASDKKDRRIRKAVPMAQCKKVQEILSFEEIDGVWYAVCKKNAYILPL